MLMAVGVVNRSQRWYEMRNGIVPHEQCCPAGVPGTSDLTGNMHVG
jgi:hypothetical protein